MATRFSKPAVNNSPRSGTLLGRQQCNRERRQKMKLTACDCAIDHSRAHCVPRRISELSAP